VANANHRGSIVASRSDGGLAPGVPPHAVAELPVPSVVCVVCAMAGPGEAHSGIVIPSFFETADYQLFNDLIMKTPIPQPRRAAHGFTLIELLVVIAIIGILAGLLLPALGKAKNQARVTQAKVEIKNIEGAISKYEADYSRYPASQQLRSRIPDGDFTFGTQYGNPAGSSTSLFDDKNKVAYDAAKPPRIPVRKIVNGYPYENCNVEVMAALLDRTNLVWNSNHAMNPNKTGYLNAREVSDSKTAGVGLDGVYRDPWGNPYIITVDLNGDDKCRDAFYKLDSVSAIPNGGDKGYNGLFRPAGPNTFEANKPVMVWSFGPDGLISDQQKANTGMNKDNILSWQ